MKPDYDKILADSNLSDKARKHYTVLRAAAAVKAHRPGEHGAQISNTLTVQVISGHTLDNK